MTADELTGFDAVVHLAALSNDPIGDLNPGWTYDINLDGSVELARRAKEAGVGGSCSRLRARCTARPAGDELLAEEAPLRPLTAYAESKVRAEEALCELADDDFAPSRCGTRPRTVASPRLRLDIVLNNLVGWAHTTGAIKLQSDGTAWRPLVHIRDIAAATVALLAAPPDAVRGEAFNIGSAEQNYRIRELADVVQESCPAARSNSPRGPGPTRGATASTSASSRGPSRARDRVDRTPGRRRAGRGIPRRRTNPRGLRSGRPLRPAPPLRSLLDIRRARRRVAAGSGSQKGCVTVRARAGGIA